MFVIYSGINNFISRFSLLRKTKNHTIIKRRRGCCRSHGRVSTFLRSVFFSAHLPHLPYSKARLLDVTGRSATSRSDEGLVVGKMTCPRITTRAIFAGRMPFLRVWFLGSGVNFTLPSFSLVRGMDWSHFIDTLSHTRCDCLFDCSSARVLDPRLCFGGVFDSPSSCFWHLENNCPNIGNIILWCNIS